jgi:hypothetical protein
MKVREKMKPTSGPKGEAAVLAKIAAMPALYRPGFSVCGSCSLHGAPLN